MQSFFKGFQELQPQVKVSFRTPFKHYISKCIQKFGFESVESILPEEYAKLGRSIVKQERYKKQKVRKEKKNDVVKLRIKNHEQVITNEDRIEVENTAENLLLKYGTYPSLCSYCSVFLWSCQVLPCALQIYIDCGCLSPGTIC